MTTSSSMEPISMQLTQAQLDYYWQKGWLVVNDVVPPREVDVVVSEAMSISERDLAENVKVGKNYLADQSADGKAAPRKIDHPYNRSDIFRQLTRHPNLLELLKQLIGPSPMLCTDQIFMKPPHFGSAKPYHQDNAYFLCSPPDKVVTAWIALDDVDEANGCLRYIDGSHREGILPHVPVPGEPHNQAPVPESIDLKRESLAIVKKGGVVFHHSETLHTSHRNESPRWRRAYATHWVTPEVTSNSSVIEKAYFNQASTH